MNNPRFGNLFDEVYNSYVEELIFGPPAPQVIDAGTYHKGVSITSLPGPQPGDSFKKRTCSA